MTNIDDSFDLLVYLFIYQCEYIGIDIIKKYRNSKFLRFESISDLVIQTRNIDAKSYTLLILTLLILDLLHIVLFLRFSPRPPQARRHDYHVTNPVCQTAHHRHHRVHQRIPHVKHKEG